MWVAVGWSSDVIPVAKRMSNVAVIVPKSGASLWADLWVCFSVCYLDALIQFTDKLTIFMSFNSHYTLELSFFFTFAFIFL